MQVISREDLYRRVWAEPMIRVAAAFGVSGTALKKTCDRHDVPTPERGYWAKLAYGKPVTQDPLPPLKNGVSNQVRVRPSPARRLAPAIRAAAEAARAKAAAAPVGTPAPAPDHPALAATRKAIAKAKPAASGFISGSGRGVVPFCIGPGSAERGIIILAQLFRLLETQGHGTGGTDQGLVLQIDGEHIAIRLDESPERVSHQPTPKELKLKADRLSWGSTADPWPKYDHAPSGRLAVVIRENDYSGLRRSYADRKAKSLDAMLPDVLAGLTEHAALKKERRLRREEEARLAAIREVERLRKEAFDRREKRRWEFVDAIDAALSARAKLLRVRAHLEAAPAEEAFQVATMLAWAKRRFEACEAQPSPIALDLSAQTAEVEFDERAAAAGENGTDEYRYYARSPELFLWLVDEAANQARSCSTYQWLNSGPEVADRGRQTTDDNRG